MTIDRKETPPQEGASSGTTQVGQVIGGLERLTRRLPSGRPRRPRPYRSIRSAPPREQIAGLVAALGDTSHPLHSAAVDELVEIGVPAVPLICDVIGPQQPWLTAYRAADAAGRIGDGRAAGPLISALSHPNSNVRWSAVRALTTVGDVRALFELRRVAQNDQGRTSWGEPVAGAAQSALDQLNQRSVWGQSVELIKTAVSSVLMILALTLAFSVVSTARGEFERFGLYIPGQTQLPQLVLPTVAPTATRPPQPTSVGIAAPDATVASAPTSVFGATSAITGTVQQASNVRP
ncbi:MAG: HEAT repeat domain-containing protein, partial [Chloroflexales bacterium]